MEFRPPVSLVGRWIRLEPLVPSAAAALASAAADPEVGRFLLLPAPPEEAGMRGLIARLLARERAGTDLVFSVTDAASRTPVGMTRFLEIDRDHGRVEIGGTWLARALWRSPANTEAKLLLLRHAFETEGVHRVQFKADLRNERSQRAIERLGATREGILREHMVMPDGYRRSSVVYGIVADEWPNVRARLERLSRRPWPGAGLPVPA